MRPRSHLPRSCRRRCETVCPHVRKAHLGHLFSRPTVGRNRTPASRSRAICRSPMIVLQVDRDFRPFAERFLDQRPSRRDCCTSASAWDHVPGDGTPWFRSISATICCARSCRRSGASRATPPSRTSPSSPSPSPSASLSVRGAWCGAPPSETSSPPPPSPPPPPPPPRRRRASEARAGARGRGPAAGVGRQQHAHHPHLELGDPVAWMADSPVTSAPRASPRAVAWSSPRPTGPPPRRRRAPATCGGGGAAQRTPRRGHECGLAPPRRAPPCCRASRFLRWPRRRPARPRCVATRSRAPRLSRLELGVHFFHAPSALVHLPLQHPRAPPARKAGVGWWRGPRAARRGRWRRACCPTRCALPTPSRRRVLARQRPTPLPCALAMSRSSDSTKEFLTTSSTDWAAERFASRRIFPARGVFTLLEHLPAVRLAVERTEACRTARGMVKWARAFGRACRRPAHRVCAAPSSSSSSGRCCHRGHHYAGLEQRASGPTPPQSDDSQPL